MDLGLRGRTAAIAASSAGLGFASAAALAAEGVTVAICGRDRGRIDAAAARIGPNAHPIVADVSDAAGATRFVEQAIEAIGPLDVLVTNGGGPPPGNFASTPLERYAPALELSLLSVVAMCHAAVPAMRARRWGRIVAITSIAVRQPIPQLILSNTARAGVTGFLKTLAREIAADGVTVNTLQPGLHATDRVQELYTDPAAATVGIPAGFIGDPGDFGAIVTFLCSDQARFVTGAHLQVDGGTYGGLL
jgi:3-oxoacyl-[acyl-carrier protein] reductase